MTQQYRYVIPAFLALASLSVSTGRVEAQLVINGLGSGGIASSDAICTSSSGAVISRDVTCVLGGSTGTATGITITGGTGVTISGGTGIAVTGANITTNQTVQGQTVVSTGNTNVGGALAVTGATSTNGITNTGNITNSGNYSSTNGNITTTNGNITATNGTVTGNGIVAGSGGLTVNGATQFNGGVSVGQGQTISMGGNRVQNVGTPIAATDAANKAYVDSMNETNNMRINDAFRRIDQNTQGIAIAIAMGGMALPSNKTFGIGANIGFYEGKQAAAATAAFRLDENVTLHGAIGAGFDGSSIGGRIGVMAAF